MSHRVKASVVAALAGVLAASGCTVYPRAESVTSAPTVSFATVPDAPEEAPVPSASAAGLRLRTVWSGGGNHPVQIAIAGDTVVVASEEGDDAELTVVDSRSGKTLWRTQSRRLELGPDGAVSVDYPGSVHVAPVAGRELLLLPFTVSDCDQHAECDVRATGTVGLDLRSGAMVWKRVLGAIDETDEEDYLYPGAARVSAVAGFTLIVDLAASAPWRLTETDAVVGLDARTGQVRWRATGYTRPTVAGDVVVAAILAAPEPGEREARISGLAGLDAASGKQRWSTPVAAMGQPGVMAGGTRYAVVVTEGGVGQLVDARTGQIVRALGEDNGDCRRASDQELVCLNGTENHLKIIDLADGSQTSVPTPPLTRRLYADDGTRSFLADDRDSVVVDRSGAIVAAGDIPSAAILAVAGSVLVRTQDDPSSATADPAMGPVTIGRIAPVRTG